LREEIYLLDDTNKAEVPWSILDKSYIVSILQGAASLAPGAFLITPFETISIYMERIITDYRISYNLVLETDLFSKS
jgi:hypothetical protein